MAGRKSAELSPESIARANRQRLAAEEGVRAMADIERQAAAVRKNMERLRALRQARDGEVACHSACFIAAPQKGLKTPSARNRSYSVNAPIK